MAATITGKVVLSDGTPLVGATVTVSGVQNVYHEPNVKLVCVNPTYTTTDSNGNFQGTADPLCSHHSTTYICIDISYLSCSVSYMVSGVGGTCVETTILGDTYTWPYPLDTNVGTFTVPNYWKYKTYDITVTRSGISVGSGVSVSLVKTSDSSVLQTETTNSSGIATFNINGPWGYTVYAVLQGYDCCGASFWDITNNCIAGESLTANFDGLPTVQVSTARTLMGTWSYAGGFTDGSSISSSSKLCVIIVTGQTCNTDTREIQITYIDNNDVTQTVDVDIGWATNQVRVLNVSAKDVTNIVNLTGTTSASVEVRNWAELSSADIFCYPDTHTFTNLGTFTIGSGFVDGSTGGEYGGKIRGLVTTDIDGTCNVTVNGTAANGLSFVWTGIASNLVSGSIFSLSINSATFRPIKNVTNISVSGSATVGTFKIQGEDLAWWGQSNVNGVATSAVSGGGSPIYPGNYDFEAYKQGYSFQIVTKSAKFCRWFEDISMSGGRRVFSLLTKDNSLLIFYAK